MLEGLEQALDDLEQALGAGGAGGEATVPSGDEAAVPSDAHLHKPLFVFTFCECHASEQVDNKDYYLIKSFLLKSLQHAGLLHLFLR